MDRVDSNSLLEPWEVELLYGACSQKSKEFVIKRIDYGIQGPLTEEATIFETEIRRNIRAKRLSEIVACAESLDDGDLSRLHRFTESMGSK